MLDQSEAVGELLVVSAVVAVPLLLSPCGLFEISFKHAIQKGKYEQVGKGSINYPLFFHCCFELLCKIEKYI